MFESGEKRLKIFREESWMESRQKCNASWNLVRSSSGLRRFCGVSNKFQGLQEIQVFPGVFLNLRAFQRRSRRSQVVSKRSHVLFFVFIDVYFNLLLILHFIPGAF